MNGSLDSQDMFVYQPASDKRISHTPATNLSINELISSLYVQSEQVSSMNDREKQTNVKSNFSDAVSNSSVGQLEDIMWEFGDATQTKVGSGEYLNNIGDMHSTPSSQMKMNNHLDFYLKLKKQLCLVIERHIEDLRVCNES